MITPTSLPNTQNELCLNPRLTLIETSEECSDIVEEFISNEKIIGLDCEGVNLSKEGKLTLIQV